MEPYRPVLAGRRPQTLRPCGGHLGPGLFLVAVAPKEAITPISLVPTARGRILALTNQRNLHRSGDQGTLVPGASANWQTVLPDGTALGDIRYTLQTGRG